MAERLNGENPHFAKLRAAQKRLRQIDELRQTKDAGAALDAAQTEKLKTAPKVVAEAASARAEYDAWEAAHAAATAPPPAPKPAAPKAAKAPAAKAAPAAAEPPAPTPAPAASAPAAEAAAPAPAPAPAAAASKPKAKKAPAAAAPAPAAAVAEDVEGLPEVQDLRRKLRNARKKLQAIDELKAKQSAGGELDAGQVAKLKTRPAAASEVASIEGQLKALGATP